MRMQVKVRGTDQSFESQTVTNSAVSHALAANCFVISKKAMEMMRLEARGEVIITSDGLLQIVRAHFDRISPAEWAMLANGTCDLETMNILLSMFVQLIQTLSASILRLVIPSHEVRVRCLDDAEAQRAFQTITAVLQQSIGLIFGQALNVPSTQAVDHSNESQELTMLIENEVSHNVNSILSTGSQETQLIELRVASKMPNEHTSQNMLNRAKHCLQMCLNGLKCSCAKTKGRASSAGSSDERKKGPCHCCFSLFARKNFLKMQESVDSKILMEVCSASPPSPAGSPRLASPDLSSPAGSPRLASSDLSSPAGSPRLASPAGSPTLASPAGSPRLASPTLSSRAGSSRLPSPALSSPAGSPRLPSPALSSPAGSPRLAIPAGSPRLASPARTPDKDFEEVRHDVDEIFRVMNMAPCPGSSASQQRINEYLQSDASTRLFEKLTNMMYYHFNVFDSNTRQAALTGKACSESALLANMGQATSANFPVLNSFVEFEVRKFIKKLCNFMQQDPLDYLNNVDLFEICMEQQQSPPLSLHSHVSGHSFNSQRYDVFERSMVHPKACVPSYVSADVPAIVLRTPQEETTESSPTTGHSFNSQRYDVFERSMVHPKACVPSYVSADVLAIVLRTPQEEKRESSPKTVSPQPSQKSPLTEGELMTETVILELTRKVFKNVPLRQREKDGYQTFVDRLTQKAQDQIDLQDWQITKVGKNLNAIVKGVMQSLKKEYGTSKRLYKASVTESDAFEDTVMKYLQIHIDLKLYYKKPSLRSRICKFICCCCC